MSTTGAIVKSKLDPELLKARALGILNRLCLVGGSMRVSALGDSKTFFYRDPVKFLKQFPCFFRLEYRRADSDWLVHAHTQAQLCTEFGKESGCLNLQCEKLHLCKHFVTGRCRFGDSCRSSHQLHSRHNEAVLGIHCLTGLDDEIVRLILKQSVVELTVPDVCTHYNSIHGCNKDNRCPFLHICLHYIKGDCRYTNTRQQRCRYSHCLLDPQPVKVLQKFNIDTSQSMQTIIDILKYKISSGKRHIPPTDDALVSSLGEDFAKTSLSRQKLDGYRPFSPSSAQQPDEVFVCVFHLRGKCNYAEKCHNIHAIEPFQWQYHETSSVEWRNFSTTMNQKIEESFCRPDRDNYYISVVDNTEGSSILNGATIDFDQMKVEAYGFMTPVEIRRITPPDEGQGWRKVYATQWLWYWKDEIGTWIEYGKQNLKGMKSDIDSNSLEEAYQNFLKEGSSRFLDFQTDSHQYRLDLEKKIQKNITYLTERQLRRRPMPVTTQALNDRAARLETQSSFTVPDHWDIYAKATNSQTNFQRCLVSKGVEEFCKVQRRFNQTMSSNLYTIDAIERIQNMDLWEDFCRKKDRMEKKYNGKKVQEELLFHGTKHGVVDAICQQNFDWRLSGTRVGAAYGQGSYFHKAASYSDRYTTPDGHRKKFMFSARVLVGTFTTGSPMLRRPPPKDPTRPHHELYDTCVDNENDPSIFVVFENNQVYPEYIIKYH